MHTSLFRTAALAALLVPTLAAQPPIDDAMWFAARQGRQLTKVSPCGDIQQTVDLTGNGFDLSQVARAPDGKLWLVNFITATMTILDRNGAIVQNVPTAGNPLAIVFDKAGNAYVSFNTTTVTVYDANANLLRSHTLGASQGQGMSIDKAGKIWVAHRTAPGDVSVIDPVTNMVTTIPMTTSMQPTRILADNPGIGMPSRIWVIGDSGNTVAQIDSTTVAVVTNHVVGPTTGFYGGITQAGDGMLWISRLRVGPSMGEIYKVDPSNGSVLLTVPLGPEPIGMGTDSFGRPWVVNRISFSGPTPSEAQRLNQQTGAIEVRTQVGVGAYNVLDPNGFQHALVVDELADADGDGSPNVIECTNRSSPYDPQSTQTLSLLSIGTTSIGSTPQIVASGSANNTLSLLFATKRHSGFALPGFTGQVRLDPAQVVPIVLTVPALPATLNVPIPNNPTLIGFVLHTQGVATGTLGVRLSNDTCIKVH